MKNISFGNWITIALILGNILFTAGIVARDVEDAQKSANTALVMAYDNDKHIAVMETRITQGFANLEKLIKNGK